MTLDGGSGVNTLTGPNGTNTWQVSGLDQGTLNGNVAFRGFQGLIGGTANDTFHVQSGGSIYGTVTGGGGLDALDYSQFPGDVVVNCQPTVHR